MMSAKESHEALADELTGLIRDVVMLHAPDAIGQCAGCNVGPWIEQEPYVAYQQWPCPTVKLVREGVGFQC